MGARVEDEGASYESLQRKRKLSEAMMQQGMSTAPVGHWMEGLARVANAGIGAWKESRLDEQEKAATAPFNKLLADAISGGSSAPVAPQPGGAAPSVGPVVGGDMSQPRGIRNNNPGNIEDGPFTKGLPGYAGGDGRFARFDTPEAGVGAQGRLLDVYNDKHGLNTVSGIVGRWAPSTDGNNVSAYAASVARQMGVDASAPLDMKRPASQGAACDGDGEA